MMGESMTARTCLAIVLAAGEGTRMRSSRPKVLHAIAGRALLAHVLAAVAEAGSARAAVVVGPDHDAGAGPGLPHRRSLSSNTGPRSTAPRRTRRSGRDRPRHRRRVGDLRRYAAA